MLILTEDGVKAEAEAGSVSLVGKAAVAQAGRLVRHARK